MFDIFYCGFRVSFSKSSTSILHGFICSVRRIIRRTYVFTDGRNKKKNMLKPNTVVSLYKTWGFPHFIRRLKIARLIMR